MLRSLLTYPQETPDFLIIMHIETDTLGVAVNITPATASSRALSS
jgi:hypothetical protein